MNAEEINKKMQTEKDSFNRNLNRLQKQIFELKQRHQRTMEYWQRQKQIQDFNVPLLNICKIDNCTTY